MIYLRRDFLKGLVVVAGTSALWGFPFPAMAAETEAAADRYLLVAAKNSVCAIHLKTRQVLEIPLGFHAHGFIQNPHQPERIWTSEKWGTAAAEVDFRQKKVIHRLTSPEGSQFGGHGVLFPDMNTVFLGRVDYSTMSGHMTGYDVDSAKPVCDYRISTGSPHECRLLPDNTVLVANTRNTEKTSALIHVDLQQGRVLGHQAIQDRDQFLAHFFLTRDGNIFTFGEQRAGSTDKSGFIYFGALGQSPLKKIELPENVEAQLKGEILSIAVNEQEHVALITNPHGNLILFIDTRTGKFLGSMREKLPRSVSFDSGLGKFICGADRLVVLNGDKRSETAFLKDDSGRDLGRFNGAHSTIVQMKNL